MKKATLNLQGSDITLDGYTAEYYEYPNDMILIIEKIDNYEIFTPNQLLITKKEFIKTINKNGNFKTI